MIPTLSHIGSQQPIGLTRKCIEFSSNLTFSYIPQDLFDPQQPLSAPVEQLTLKPLVTKELLEQMRGDLDNHIEQRIQLFLQQMILVYKTKLCFALYTHADFQVGKVPSVGGKSISTYVAAHSGTLPTLRLQPKKGEDCSISLFQDTSFYYSWNATIFLPEIANQIDSAIDKVNLSQQKCSLRECGTEILNRVSQGNISPQEGLDEFLVALTNAIAQISKESDSEERKIILQEYALTANSYKKQCEKREPLIQRFCLQPIEKKIDEAFFLDAQREMYQTLQPELDKLQPPTVLIPALPIAIDVAPLQSAFTEWLPKRITSLTEEYIKICLASPAVRKTSIDFLNHLHSLPSADRRSAIRTPPSTLVNAIQGALAQRTEKPRNMDVIILSLLLSLCREIQEAQAIPLSSSQRKLLCDKIQKKIETGNYGTSVTTERYIRLCKTSDKVKKSAQSYFEELGHLPSSAQDKALDKLCSIKPAKIGSAGLSPKALAFYEEIIATLPTTHPRNLPLLLFRSLLPLD